MSLYTRAIHFKNDETLTITEEEMQAIQQALLSGNKWLKVQGEMISIDTVARIGNHHATAEMKKREAANMIRELELSGRSDLVDDQRRLQLSAAIEKSAELQASLPVISKSVKEQSDFMYWQDEHGIRHYS